MTEAEFLAACGKGAEYLQEWLNAPHYKLKHRNGETIDIQLEPEGIYQSSQMTFHDAKGNIYKKEIGTAKMYICLPYSGEPDYTIGELDWREMLDSLHEIPHRETWRIAKPWKQFPAGTRYVEILDWIEREFKFIYISREGIPLLA